jgi:tRNA dimethylallyltransferase
MPLTTLGSRRGEEVGGPSVTAADMALSGIEVLAVCGPTASGKSAVAEALASRLGTDTVSADALQVYRELPILTNQPERPTRLVGIRSIEETMSVGEYARLAHAAIDELVAAHGSAVVVGGTGLYVRAALADLRLPPPAPPEVRARWEVAYDADPGGTYAELARRDPAAAGVVHPRDRRRVVRALELASVGASLVPDRDRLWSSDHRRPTLIVGLEVPVEELERRIRARTVTMFRTGVLEEVHAALAGQVSVTAEKALGLREIAAMPPSDALERLTVLTRQYAAYQRKWMRRIPGLVSVDATGSAHEVADAILEVARTR